MKSFRTSSGGCPVLPALLPRPPSYPTIQNSFWGAVPGPVGLADYVIYPFPSSALVGRILTADPSLTLYSGGSGKLSLNGDIFF